MCHLESPEFVKRPDARRADDDESADAGERSGDDDGVRIGILHARAVAFEASRDSDNDRSDEQVEDEEEGEVVECQANVLLDMNLRAWKINFESRKVEMYVDSLNYESDDANVDPLLTKLCSVADVDESSDELSRGGLYLCLGPCDAYTPLGLKLWKRDIETAWNVSLPAEISYNFFMSFMLYLGCLMQREHSLREICVYRTLSQPDQLVVMSVAGLMEFSVIRERHHIELALSYALKQMKEDYPCYGLILSYFTLEDCMNFGFAWHVTIGDRKRLQFYQLIVNQPPVKILRKYLTLFCDKLSCFVSNVSYLCDDLDKGLERLKMLMKNFLLLSPFVREGKDVTASTQSLFLCLTTPVQQIQYHPSDPSETVKHCRHCSEMIESMLMVMDPSTSFC